MYRLDNGKASRWSLSFYSREDSGQIRLLKSVTSTASGPRCTCTSTTVVGSHLGVRIWNFGPKKPSNVRISTKNILTFDGSSSLSVEPGTG